MYLRPDEEADDIYRALIKNEMFGDELSANTTMMDPPRTPPRSSARTSLPPSTPKTPSRNLFTFMSPSQRGSLTPGSRPNSNGSGGSNRSGDLPTRDIYSLSPIRFDSQRLLLSPRREPRAIPKVPYKVLDAPDLKDDFYLNLVDWGAQNILAVGLGSSVYLWNAHNGVVKKLVDLGDQDHITGIGWIQTGTHLAVGTNKGLVRIWDTESSKPVRTMTGHTQRVGTHHFLFHTNCVGSLAWNEHILTSGSRDRTILHRDVRVSDQYFRKLTSHKQEVCGLRWNSDEVQLASGGNDNKLFIWNGTDDKPMYSFNAHIAAVKAISWSPHHRGILASGGGTADRKIRFWNSMNGQCVNEIDTGSQVCNLAWSKNSNELVSTHGYSQNQVAVWKYPSMTQVAALTGHTSRVLYLAMSPDGQTIVTGAGDETLRFWTIFAKSKQSSSGGIFDSMNMIR